MFEESLIESAAKMTSSRQKYTTCVSFAMQVAVIGVLVLIPLLYTDALPQARLSRLLEAPPPPAPRPEPARVMNVVSVETEVIQGQLLQPHSIPARVHIVEEQEAPAPPISIAGVVNAIAGGEPTGPIGDIINSVIPAVPKEVIPKKIRISQGVAAGLLQHEVKPTYPRRAIQMRVQGPVILKALISKDGSIQNLRVVSGHPMLVKSAIDAVQQWHYRPYLLSGEPVEVETEITVNFVLAGG